MKCCQCGKQAIVQYQFGPLCVDCDWKLAQAQESRSQGYERMINYLSDQMDATLGIGRIGARFPEPKPPVINHAPVTLNSIAIDRSVVGSVNTGYISSLEINMSGIQQVNSDGADKIKEFAEAVLKEDRLGKIQKEEIIQQLNYLVEQFKVPAEKRSMAVIKSVGTGIIGLINFSASLVALWGPVKALLGI
ncbi:MAG: hypothetical protein UX80_C0010G0015 [Candidatus Amesbacteria bacterium GW2011_GWA2_47_11b]|uniref:Uncharacterized protein n=2 Tax=Candidatus Amesiibacteriota TaxID=1752730 RepID=A0A0G1RKC4_9BACT|nr:MAG: hypothetical protein UX42_C0007G0026 [Microgenomates group bacterium GW2011_GWC1_46_20]KKU57754.1 MAG: hypothetical protein UX80_C0010G0015 [Candidatus Amesbacteria bacterium GW2011_GWA2_47_11b]KKU83058.1 MAG: hypothetical protein UY11_C0030G0013 [Candidatus Amesbacteria bacterium GW2011_GWC2_47_8]